MTQIGINYANALYDLAAEEKLTGEILQQLQLLNTVFSEEPAFLRLLSAPNVPKQERCDIVDKSFRGKVHPYVLNFLKLLTERSYARYFSDCCKAYEERYNMDNGIMPVCAVTAIPLQPDQFARLTEKLQTITGKTVKLHNRVEPSCLGGVRLTYDGKQVDGTVKNRLDAIGKLLKNTVL